MQVSLSLLATEEYDSGIEDDDEAFFSFFLLEIVLHTRQRSGPPVTPPTSPRVGYHQSVYVNVQ